MCQRAFYSIYLTHHSASEMHLILLYVVAAPEQRRCPSVSLTLCIAREDAAKMRKLVDGSHERRLVRAASMDGPMPSQRAVNSLDSVSLRYSAREQSLTLLAPVDYIRRKCACVQTRGMSKS